PSTGGYRKKRTEEAACSSHAVGDHGAGGLTKACCGHCCIRALHPLWHWLCMGFSRITMAASPKKKQWGRNVKTVLTVPPKGVFTKDAETIARTMANRKVSPKGIGSGIRMIQYFINRGGKGLSKARKRELEKAKRILQARAYKHKK